MPRKTAVVVPDGPGQTVASGGRAIISSNGTSWARPRQIIGKFKLSRAYRPCGGPILVLSIHIAKMRAGPLLKPHKPVRERRRLQP